MPEMNITSQDEDAVLKEVWNVDGVEAKTELDVGQIESISKLSTMAEIFGNSVLDEHLRKFMILQKSKDRKSMGEFVDVVKAKRDDAMNQGKGFFSSMMG